MDVDATIAREAILRDLICYSDQLRCLQQEEVEAAYGPVFHEAADIDDLRRKGICTHDVTLCAGVDCVVATWARDAASRTRVRVEWNFVSTSHRFTSLHLTSLHFTSLHLN